MDGFDAARIEAHGIAIKLLVRAAFEPADRAALCRDACAELERVHGASEHGRLAQQELRAVLD